MKGRDKFTEVSALLDGEVRGEQLVRLNEELAASKELTEEFAEQRSVKALLSQLPEFEAPDYLATRVAGMIAEGRGKQSRGLSMSWRMITAGAAGFALCLLSVGTYMIAGNPARDSANQLADRGAQHDMVVPAGLTESTDGIFKPQDWDNENLNAWRKMELSDEEKGKVDDRLEEFLRFAADVHGYEIMERSADATAADIPEAMLLMVGDEGGGE